MFVLVSQDLIPWQTVYDRIVYNRLTGEFEFSWSTTHERMTGDFRYPQMDLLKGLMTQD